jgi:transposase-like protein
MIKKRRGSLGDTGYMDEVYIVTVRGERRYLWRTVDQERLPHERGPAQAKRMLWLKRVLWARRRSRYPGEKA